MAASEVQAGGQELHTHWRPLLPARTRTLPPTHVSLFKATPGPGPDPTSGLTVSFSLFPITSLSPRFTGHKDFFLAVKGWLMLGTPARSSSKTGFGSMSWFRFIILPKLWPQAILSLLIYIHTSGTPDFGGTGSGCYGPLVLFFGPYGRLPHTCP